MSHALSHAEGRVIHDADGHIIETRGWLESCCPEAVRNNLQPGIFSLDLPQLDPIIEQADRRLAGDDPDMTAALRANLFGHKAKRNQWMAYGAVDNNLAVTALKLALDAGIRAVWFASDATDGRAPSHVACDPLWAMLEEAGVPVTLHIGSGRNMPSEYVQRQVWATPLHTEYTGWILRNVGPDMLMFNTDYPHPEGGGDPFGAFERSLDAVAATSQELDRFYAGNYADFLGVPAAA